jgi:hypothetical protein
MVKAKSAQYGVGRTKDVGTWWKWKVDPYAIDAVLIYAQAGHGRRASLYTDYTFAVWDEEEGERRLVPFAKAYSGLTDAEIAQVDSAIRKTTIEKFGPVRSVKPTMVFEIGFEGIALSSRHKAGIAVRFPRILRRRDDKTVEDADTLDTLKGLLAASNAGRRSRLVQAAALLGIHLFVGQQQVVGQRLLADRVALHDPGAHRHRVRPLLHQVEGAQVGADAREDHVRLLVVERIGHELVAADARDHVGLAERLAEHGPRVADRAVAAVVAEFIVDRLRPSMSAKMTALRARLRRATLNRCSAWTKKPRRLYRPVSTSVSESMCISLAISPSFASSAAWVRGAGDLFALGQDSRSSELRASILPSAAAASSSTVSMVCR